MAKQDVSSKHNHAMEEEADVSGGTGGRLGGDLDASKSRGQSAEKQAGERGTAGEHGKDVGRGKHQSEAG